MHFTRGGGIFAPQSNSQIKIHESSKLGMPVGAHQIFLEKLVLS